MEYIDKMGETSEGKTWNQELVGWFEKSGKSFKNIKDESGIPRSSFSDYIHSRVTDLGRISSERLGVLYSLTGLECFKYETPRIEVSEPRERVPKEYGGAQEGSSRVGQGRHIVDMAKQKKGDIERTVDQAASQLTGRERLEAGMLKAQRYSPEVGERADAIMELLDVLGEEIDYFRTAPENEKKVLIERLQEEPESFGYVSQMLNIIYGGKKMDSWMLMVQPPSKIKRLTKGRQ